MGIRESLSANVKVDNSRVVPIGTIEALATDVVPPGWFECDGSAISRLSYAELFAAIAEKYGDGDGLNTFNLPDFRGRFMRGWDNGVGLDPGAGARIALSGGTASGDQVGSYQVQTAFHDHETGDGVNFVGRENGTNLYGGVSPNEPNDTRPSNVSLMWIIKY